MSNLKQLLTTILEERNTKLIPPNIKAGVTIMGMTGTYEGEGGEATPPVITFSGTDNGVYMINYGGWSDTYVHSKLDKYLTTEAIDTIFDFYNLNPNTPRECRRFVEGLDPNIMTSIVNAMCVDLQDTESETILEHPFFTQFFIVTDKAGTTPILEIMNINTALSSKNSINIYLVGAYQVSITIKTDESTGELFIVMDEFYNEAVDTYEADAEPEDVAAGKKFVSQGQLLEGTATFGGLTTIDLTDLVVDSEAGRLVSMNTTAAQYMLDNPGEAFKLNIGLSGKASYSYTAMVTTIYNEVQDTEEDCIKILTTEDDHSTAKISIEPRGEQPISLWDVTFQIEPSN